MSAYSSITSALRTLETCPLVEDVVGALESRLRSHIAGQDEAVAIVRSAVAAWEMNRRSASGEPLVMAFTGPTGVGKVRHISTLSIYSNRKHSQRRRFE